METRSAAYISILITNIVQRYAQAAQCWLREDLQLLWRLFFFITHVITARNPL